MPFMVRTWQQPSGNGTLHLQVWHLLQQHFAPKKDGVAHLTIVSVEYCNFPRSIDPKFGVSMQAPIFK